MIGYEFLLSRLPLRMPPLGLPAQVRPVARIELSETRDSYAIESEAPSPDQERACLQAMEPFRDHMPLTEDCPAALQNVVIMNDQKLEQSFRRRHDWLQRGGHRALAVRRCPAATQRPGFVDQ